MVNLVTAEKLRANGGTIEERIAELTKVERQVYDKTATYLNERLLRESKASTSLCCTVSSLRAVIQKNNPKLKQRGPGDNMGIPFQKPFGIVLDALRGNGMNVHEFNKVSEKAKTGTDKAVPHVRISWEKTTDGRDGS
ncbi:MAG: hypothetical protein H6922_04225 [Pseudomonadaceae bacterium]|nr:hypothetical protein [Pseudomonadaceae bacterium]